MSLDDEGPRRDDVADLSDPAESQRRFTALAHLTTDFIHILEYVSKRARYRNRSLPQALGYTPEQIVALGERLLPSITHPQDLAVVVDCWAELESRAEGSPVEYARRLRDSTGRYRWFATRETVLSRNAAGGPMEILGTTREITALKEAERRLDELTRVDPVTGLPNQRAIRERLDLLFAEGVRGRAFALVMVDLDHWQRLSDTHGPAAGDRVLVAVAKAFRGSVRKTDLVGRYGTDEFCVLLLDVKPAAAVALAEKLRRGLGRITDPFSVTATFGVRCYDPSTPNPVALVNAAEQAVARGKQMGRNRVELASP